MQNTNRIWIIVWVILAAAGTVVAGLGYGLTQQNYRQSANDPQIEITEEVAAAIIQGATADQIIPEGTPTTDMSKSMTAFVMILDKDGKVVGTSSKLDGETPTPPKGMLDAAKDKDRNMVTWQPKEGVRIAAVVRAVKNGQDEVFVLSGKNIREVEKRIAQVFKMVVAAWAILLILAAVLVYALQILFRSRGVVVENDTLVIVEGDSQKDTSNTAENITEEPLA